MLRLAANTAALSEWLPECLADFLRAHPNIDLAVTEQGSEEAADAVREERADLAVVADHADLTGLQAVPFRQDRLVLIVAHDHPLAAAGAVALADIAGLQMLGLSADNALQRHLRRQLARSGVQLRLRARVHGIEALCRMVARGAGAAIIPQAALARSAVRPQLVALTLHERWARRQLSIVVSAAQPLSPPLRALRDWLQAEASQAAPHQH
ncbi:hypothetical protein CKY51_10375 [Xanthomonas maliensis]|nr:hypothetical protein CKY51_10375 [Xanthomonas maliensis]